MSNSNYSVQRCFPTTSSGKESNQADFLEILTKVNADWIGFSDFNRCWDRNVIAGLLLSNNQIVCMLPFAWAVTR